MDLWLNVCPSIVSDLSADFRIIFCLAKTSGGWTIYSPKIAIKHHSPLFPKSPISRPVSVSLFQSSHFLGLAAETRKRYHRHFTSPWMANWNETGWGWNLFHWRRLCLRRTPNKCDQLVHTKSIEYQTAQQVVNPKPCGRYIHLTDLTIIYFT